MNKTHFTGAIAGGAAAAIAAACLLAMPSAYAARDVAGVDAGRTAATQAAPSVGVTSTTTVQPSRPVRVKVTGFASGQPVKVTIAGRVLGSLTPGASGAAAARFTLSRHIKVGTRPLVASQAQTGRIARAAVTVHTDWPESYGNGSGTTPTTRVENSLTPDSARRWSKTWDVAVATEDIPSLTAGASAVVKGVMYTGLSYSCDSDCTAGGVASYDAATGRQRWITKLFGTGALGMGPVVGAPLVIGDQLWVQDDQSSLWILNATDGSLIKRIHDVAANFSGAAQGPVMSDGVVIAGKTIAFDPTTYERLWVLSGDHVAVTNGLVLYYPRTSSGSTTYLAAVDIRNGQEKWRVANPTDRITTDGVRVYMCESGTLDLVAMDHRTGSELWRNSAGNVGSTAVHGCRSDLAVTNGVLSTAWIRQISQSDIRKPLTGYDPATGKILWTGPDTESRGLVSAGGVLFAPVSDSLDLTVINPITGKSDGSFPRFEAKEVAIADGRVYLPGISQGRNTLIAYHPAG